MAAKKTISIFDLFGDDKELTEREILKRGDKFDLHKIVIELLLHHALDSGKVIKQYTGGGGETIVMK